MSELGGGLTLNDLSDSEFRARSVFKGIEESTPNLAPPGPIKIPELMINKSTGEEQYASLGTVFKMWGYEVLEAIEMAEIQSQFAWGEHLTGNKLGEYMAPNSVTAAYYKPA